MGAASPKVKPVNPECGVKSCAPVGKTHHRYKGRHYANSYYSVGSPGVSASMYSLAPNGASDQQEGYEHMCRIHPRTSGWYSAY